jgi:hypothetical protein
MESAIHEFTEVELEEGGIQHYKRLTNIMSKQRRANCVVLKLILYPHHKSYTFSMLKTTRECLWYIIQCPVCNVLLIHVAFQW